MIDIDRFCHSYNDFYPGLYETNVLQKFYCNKIRESLIYGFHNKEQSILHIYNMGFLFKFNYATIGFDVVLGPRNRHWEWGDCFSDLLRVDNILCSHWHPDHYDTRVTRCCKDSHINFNGEVISSFQLYHGIRIYVHRGYHIYSGQIISYFEMHYGNDAVLFLGDVDYSNIHNIFVSSEPNIVIAKFGGISPLVDNEESLRRLYYRFPYAFFILGHCNELGHPLQGGRYSWQSAKDACRRIGIQKFWVPEWGEYISWQ